MLRLVAGMAVLSYNRELLYAYQVGGASHACCSSTRYIGPTSSWYRASQELQTSIL